MITSTQREDLRKLISEYVSAAVEASMAGSLPPIAAAAARREERTSRLTLNHYLDILTEKPQTT